MEGEVDSGEMIVRIFTLVSHLVYVWLATHGVWQAP